jgi:hypothetical protein
MRIVNLTLAEAADPAVMKNVADFLLSDQHTAIYTSVKSGGTDFGIGAEMASSNVQVSNNQIAPADRPDAGMPQGPTIADLLPAAAQGFAQTMAPQPSPHVFVDASSIGFGNNLPPVPGLPSSMANIPLPPLGGAAAPVIPPVPAVPAVAAAPTATAQPSAPASVDVDANSLPWDPRIHASTKVKNADGTWRARRGVDPHLVLTVEAELRAMMAIPSPAAPATPVQAQIPMPPTIPQPPALPNPATPEAALAQSVTGDAFDALPNEQRFPAWVSELEKAMIAEHIGPDTFKEVTGQDLNVYVMRPDLIPAARKAMGDHLRARFPQAGY